MRLRIRAWAVLVAATVVSLAWAQPADAQRPIKRVLTIHFGAEAYPGNRTIDEVITKILYSHPAIEADYYAEFLEYEEFGVTANTSLRDSIRLKFRDRPLDALIADGGPAVEFALQHRSELFPEVPIVFATATTPREVLEGKVARATGVLRVPAHVETLDLALKLHPATRRVHVVAYAPNFDSYQEDVKAALAAFSTRVTLTYSNEPSLPAMLAALKTLPADSLILYARYSPAVRGRVIFPDELLPKIAEAAPVPIYSSLDTYVGKGVVGGMMRSDINLATRIGELTLRILEGAKPEDIPVEAAGISPMFDWRQVQRWGIDPSLLPVASVIMFREPSVWDRYGGYIISAVALLTVQSLLIGGLLYQRRARRRAEAESRRNLVLAADASRRQTMSALTTSIAHELIQPLTSMIHNAKAARRMITANRETPDTMDEILSDIENDGIQATQIIDRHRTMLRTRQLDKQPLDLHAVIHESVALVAHDMRARQIEATLNLSSNPCIITGDQVLLRQVLVNLVVNAMDAMAEMPPTGRCVTIRTEIRAADVEVSVRDTGTGLAADMTGKLFTSFVTSKSHGLGVGLTIARTIIEAHGGTIEARNNSDGGATFTVTLPRGAAPNILSNPASIA
jgi:signal transduction histidine kinase